MARPKAECRMKTVAFFVSPSLIEWYKDHAGKVPVSIFYREALEEYRLRRLPEGDSEEIRDSRGE